MNLPWPLMGDKVSLHAFTEADLTPAYVGWLNDPVVVRYSNQRFRRHDLETCRRYMQSFNGTPNHFISVRRCGDGTAIGTMTAYVSPPHGTVDVGILIGERSAWGQGYGQDAWNTLLQWLVQRDDIRKITAGTLACNESMLHLMQRCGMQPDGRRRAQELVDGVAHDVLYYARFKSE